MKRGQRFNRGNGGSSRRLGQAPRAGCLSPCLRRLGVELLEDRRLLSVGPQLVADISHHRTWSARPEELVEIGGTVYFMADDDVHGRELWKTDGTEAGTVLLKDIRPGPGVGRGGVFVLVGTGVAVGTRWSPKVTKNTSLLSETKTESAVVDSNPGGLISTTV